MLLEKRERDIEREDPDDMMENVASLQTMDMEDGAKGVNVLTGRPPMMLYLSCDYKSLSEYQCLVRKQIEFFESNQADVDSSAQGRNRPITLGQVGIQCRHCRALDPKQRSRGGVYYPAKLEGIYQAAQNMAGIHLLENCAFVPPHIRDELNELRQRKSSAGGGKVYWADRARVLGVYEDEEGLRFLKHWHFLSASMQSSTTA